MQNLGTHVLNSFNDTLGKNSENNQVDFVDVVSGKRAEEVARYFLSTLMLANTENVKIGTKVGTDPMLGNSLNISSYINLNLLLRNG